MKTAFHSLIAPVLLVGALLVTACDSTPRSRQAKAEEELDQLNAAMNRAFDKADTVAREKLPVIKEDLKRQAARLDTKLDSLSVESRARLSVLKRRLARYDSVNRERASQPMSAGSESAFRQELLGTYADVNTLTALNVNSAYTQFMRQVRARRTTWTQRDWDYAGQVYRDLNARYRTVRLDVRATDEVHIKALQAEFLALENGRDVKDLREALRK
ncbi:hypothetical protein LJY25_03775 [Hymenobacter sp. BT175]|uniref:hypothetical protein n=1 Tax=Hymenobacter translucens TaxID=2886507 RepID=UPI001D0E51CA|nr:hypothetical protein [Hymenobacter translucens]MCC2545551.1 hypothetical protein [Hymenobacter translucens]